MHIMGSVRLVAISIGLTMAGSAAWTQSPTTVLPTPTAAPPSPTAAPPTPTAVPPTPTAAPPTPTAVLPTPTTIPPTPTVGPTPTPGATTTPTATPVNIPIVPGAGGPGGAVPWLLVMALMALALLLVWARRAQD